MSGIPNYLDASSNIYSNTTVHDGITPIIDFTYSPWINYVDISENNPDISMNANTSTSTLSYANTIVIDYTDNNDLDMKSYLQTIDSGTSGIKALLYIINSANKSEYIIYKFKSLIDKNTYGQINVQYLTDSTDGNLTLSENNNYKIQLFKHGDRGSQGYQGLIGAQGSQGSRGEFGGASFDYTFAGQGYNADISHVNLTHDIQKDSSGVYIYKNDDNGNSIDSFMNTIYITTSTPKGFLRISKKSDLQTFLLFQVTDLSKNTGNDYWTLNTVNLLYSSASPFSSTDDILISFTVNGNKGDIGPAGPQGYTGYQGLKGEPNGPKGEAGPQGFTGYLR